MTLNIDQSTCIKCGKCVKVCPSGIFTQEKTKKNIGLIHINTCIVCGHCVDVCPTDSVQHSSFPSEKIHTIDYDKMPTPEQVMLLIKSRRSNRSLTSKSIPEEILNQIIEAANYAPTASNARAVSFTIITDPEKLLWVSDYTIGVFSSLAKVLLNPIVKCILKPFIKGVYKYVPAFERLKTEHLAGNDPILRNATALLFIHTPKSNRFGCEDSNLAYQNASLMAQSLGISQIYMGFVLTAIKQEGKDTLARKLGIDGKIHAIMALGIPAFKYPKYVDR
ncbi:nitroreductase family protein [Parabacteroides bouchesdurhonensis]|uniref:nitroreductase family protein n=1 Tax=Parabacteroides bouchesdurhonensis TaxID=1936995 RepID=UPI000E4D5AF5|nr:nitroreductase family protein [Parabacteroides bouchesdurhonensis]RHJ95259.1 4Fe-4S dicluster domain-containing protein [Bacteroides sp. AM07-16]